MNLALAGTELAMLKPESWMILPDVPLNVATCPAMTVSGQVTAPTMLDWITVQSSLDADPEA